MATTAKKKEEISPIGLVVLFLAFALAAGGLAGHGGGGRSGKGGGSSAKDPCEGKDAEHVVESWSTPPGTTARYAKPKDTIRLRCEVEGGGFQHIKDGHMREDTDPQDVLECIARTLNRGQHHQDVARGGVRDYYDWEYQPGKNARVIVRTVTGDLLTAFAGGPSDWARCAGR